MAANAAAGVSNRPVTGEPLYILLNLGYATTMVLKTRSALQIINRTTRSACT